MDGFSYSMGPKRRSPGELSLIDGTLEFGEPAVPLEGNSFEVERNKLDSLSRDNTLEFKVLFSSVNPFGGVFAGEFREIEFKGRIGSARLRVGFGGLRGVTDRKGVDVASSGNVDLGLEGL